MTDPKKPFWDALRDGDIKSFDFSRSCFCVGPQDGGNKCPCQIGADRMKWVHEHAMSLASSKPE